MTSHSRGKSLHEAGPVRTARSWFARLAERILPRKAEPVARRLLFLDDDPRRAEVFLAEHPQAVWVETVADCVERLRETWDEVHLDHDLGGKQHVGVDDVDCGMEVIRWMCKEPRDHLRSTRFFVHTHNLVAGLLMVLQMRAGGFTAEFQPFGQDLAKVLAHNEPADDDGVSNHSSNFHRWLTWPSFWQWPPRKTGRRPVRPDPDGQPAGTQPQPENCQ